MVRTFNNIEISFETNEITVRTENNSSARIKVEPRIMHVLQILLNNSPKVVSREKLISEVWNNYGGADDALNQAISHLRKLLNDTNKEDRIIETVVKKGYRFVGVTEMPPDENYKPQKSRFWVVIIAIALLLATFIVIYSMRSNNSYVPLAPVDEKPKTTVPAPKADQN